MPSLAHFKPSFENGLILKNEYRANKYVYLKVVDNGIGISKASITHLFERYYKISDSHLGSGIGLAFVRSLTFLHKGNIYVYSERDKGTEIIIAIPVSREDFNKCEKWVNNREKGPLLESIHNKYDESNFIKEESNEENKEKLSEHTKPHILMVDDNTELRKFLRESLCSQYHITEAIDGADGIVKSLEEFPDLIISDVIMPAMDGIEFCKKIKDNIETSHIPFLKLTAKESNESKIEGMDSGADFYFSKPLSIDLLLLTIKNIFNQRQKLRLRYSKEYQVEAKEKVHSTKDKEFINELLGIIETQLANPEMDVEYICLQIGMSRTKLYQKIKNITGQSIGEFVRTVRLRKAVQIMTHEDVLLTDVIYRVGIQTQSYFTKAFKKEFGKTPSNIFKN